MFNQRKLMVNNKWCNITLRVILHFLFNYILFIGNKIKYLERLIMQKIDSIEGLKKEYIKRSLNKFDWKSVSRYDRLTEDFMREFKSNIDWVIVSASQSMSESFIREFQDKIDWLLISFYQKLSEEFIEEFKDKVVWLNIMNGHRLSNNLRDKCKDIIDKEFEILKKEMIEGKRVVMLNVQ